MFKYGNEQVLLGMRFYKFIDEDEFEIYSIVRFEDDKKATFMNEETFELVTITNKELKDEYTLLTDYKLFMIALIDTALGVEPFVNEEIANYIRGVHDASISFETLVIYKFMKKSVFNKMINYILNLNSLQKQSLSSVQYKIWSMYFKYMSKGSYVMKVNGEEDKNYIDLDNVVDGDGKIPDSLFADAEEELMTCILSYEAYSYDDSVNIDNINMKHFFIYDEKNDKYYIILYVIDQARVSRQMIQDMNDNIDVVEFMLGQN